MIDKITQLRAAEAGLPAGESHPDPALVSMPLRVDWERAQRLAGVAREREPYPVPEVDSRDEMDPPSWPGPVLIMAEFAVERGWAVLRQYSRGYLPHALRGVPGRIKGWYALRMVSSDKTRRAYLTHDGTKWHSMGIWGGSIPVLVGELGVAAVRAWIEGPDDPLAFRDQVGAWLDAGEARRKARAAELAGEKRAAGLGAGTGQAL